MNSLGISLNVGNSGKVYEKEGWVNEKLKEIDEDIPCCVGVYMLCTKPALMRLPLPLPLPLPLSSSSSPSPSPSPSPFLYHPSRSALSDIALSDKALLFLFLLLLVGWLAGWLILVLQQQQDGAMADVNVSEGERGREGGWREGGMEGEEKWGERRERRSREGRGRKLLWASYWCTYDRVHNGWHQVLRYNEVV